MKRRFSFMLAAVWTILLAFVGFTVSIIGYMLYTAFYKTPVF